MSVKNQMNSPGILEYSPEATNSVWL